MTPSVVSDENQMVDLIKKKLTRDTGSTQRALRFGQLHGKLGRSTILTERWSALYLLYTLSSNKPHNSAVSSQNGLGPIRSTFAGFGLHTLDAPETRLPAADPPRLNQPQLQMRAASAQTTGSGDRRLLPPTTANVRTPREGEADPTSVPLYLAVQRAAGIRPPAVTEAELLIDLVFVLQGVDGRYIVYDRPHDTYQLRPAVAVPAPQRALVNQLASLGTQFRRVQTYLTTTRSSASAGHIVQCLGAYLEQQCTEHLKFVALIESQLVPSGTRAKVTQFAVDDGTVAEGTNLPEPIWSMTARTGLTLRRLRVWLQAPTERLTFLANLIDKCRDIQASTLLNRIHADTEHGDPTIRQLAGDMMKQITVPFFEILEHWLYNGELLDPHGESFIEQMKGASHNTWFTAFGINVLNIPAFIPSTVAAKTFTIGKAFHFLRCHCQDTAWITQQRRTMRQEVVLKYDDTFNVELSIDRANRAVCQRLHDQIFDKYRLMDHLRALKRYLLLGQGDFVQYLLRALGPELSRPATQVYRHNVSAGVETAIRASNAQYEDAAVLRQLDFHLLPVPSSTAGPSSTSASTVSATSTGWDIFELKYTMPPPIDYFLPAGLFSPYSKFFTFLWRIKYVESQLGELWCKQATAARTTLASHRHRSFPSELRGDLHRCRLWTHEMTHFVDQLQSFIQYEVIESAWTRFVDSLSSGLDTADLMVPAHRRFTTAITQFFRRRRVNFLPVLTNIFDLVFQFRRAVDNLYDYAQMETSLPHAKTPAATRDAVPERLRAIRQQLQRVHDQFRQRVTDLLSSLVRQDDDDAIRSLGERLNFNGFYTVRLASTTPLQSTTIRANKSTPATRPLSASLVNLLPRDSSA
ncbi:Microtubule-nucleating Tub4p (gamma-tubulin) complex component [Tieghemiomyces parasiticus]|uniref:Microtubule-nucleating Tub4p (Gamma-tubulin) complex component n=1 Tax=Tieghemiomyces parasiticus TaxID=78921 RepID=A0A9W8AGZ3_9FUNG|nr:Microtubule-nucleating Tub4p (gamma-tubulin) complex component [Tieghemiomyces parasiticus]